MRSYFVAWLSRSFNYKQLRVSRLGMPRAIETNSTSIIFGGWL